MLILLALVLVASVAARSQPQQPAFVPPHAVVASDIEYPIKSVASGLVSLSVGLSSSGHIDHLQPIRDVPSLTAPSVDAVQGWTFTPAMLDGRAVASTISVNVLFNPGNAAFGSARLPDAQSAVGQGNEQEYIPPEVASAVYAVYPMNVVVVVAGPVVFDVRVGKSGKMISASRIYTTPSLTTPALSALKKWRFTPGRFRGSPVVADTVVAFVFRSPRITTPFGLFPDSGPSRDRYAASDFLFLEDRATPL
jgi:Gram-negative bacterial TonB protein C-terminal